jgi:hypothetical protein
MGIISVLKIIKKGQNTIPFGAKTLAFNKRQGLGFRFMTARKTLKALQGGKISYFCCLPFANA